MHKHADMLQAVINLKTIQYRDFGKGEWHDMLPNSHVNPISGPNLQWRIKPYTVFGKEMTEPLEEAPEIGYVWQALCGAVQRIGVADLTMAESPHLSFLFSSEDEAQQWADLFAEMRRGSV